MDSRSASVDMTEKRHLFWVIPLTAQASLLSVKSKNSVFLFTNVQETLKGELCFDPFPISPMWIMSVIQIMFVWLFSGHLLNAQGGKRTLYFSFYVHHYFSLWFKMVANKLSNVFQIGLFVYSEGNQAVCVCVCSRAHKGDVHKWPKEMIFKIKVLFWGVVALLAFLIRHACCGTVFFPPTLFWNKHKSFQMARCDFLQNVFVSVLSMHAYWM